MKNSPRSKLVFVLSDLHCGSTLALLPPRFQTLEGNKVEQNAAQQWLWKCWQEAKQWIAETAGKDPYVLVVNGDLIEGNHHRTMQIISPDAAERALELYGGAKTACGLSQSRVRFLMKEQRKLWLQSVAARRASGDQEKAR